jgi:adenosylhomocysteine nucleosidase
VTIIAACGLLREAQIAAQGGIEAIASGGDAKRLAAELNRKASHAKGIVSFGIAGGLSPGLKSGACIIATEVIRGEERLGTDKAWREAMKALLPHAILAPIAGAEGIIATPEAKAALHLHSRAAAVDMESHVAAIFARERNIPFAALRVISDPAGAALPQAALTALSPDGSIRYGAVLGSILTNPAQIPEMMAAFRQSRTAFAELLRCVRVLGIGLAAPDIG